MTQWWSRTQTWSTAALVIVVLLLVGIGGLWAYVAGTAVPLYHSPADVPSAGLVAPAPEWDTSAERARRLVRGSLAAQNLPGVSVAVGMADEVVWAEGFGVADLESRQSVTPATRFRIGTASMALTSAAVGVLLEDGRLALGDEIQLHVPEFPRKDHPVTLRHVMSHTAGLRTDGGDEGPLFSQRCEQPRQALPVFAERPLLYQPGTQYRQSKYGWIVVSAAVETVAGQPFFSFMRERVFTPLGMDATGAESSTEENPDKVGEPEEDPPMFTFIRNVLLAPFGVPSSKAPHSVPDLTTSYFPRFAADPRYGLHEMRPHNLSCYAGAMAFYSTAPDLVRFGMGINGGKLLRAATVQQLQTPERLLTGEETGYGLGWDLETVDLAGRLARTAGHDGEMLGGRVASLLTVPEQGIAVAVVSNSAYADTTSIARGVLQAFARP